MTDALVLSVDELRAVSRVARFPLPDFVAGGDEDDVRVDAAALRGLALRGLARIGHDTVEVLGALDQLLLPFTAADRLTEIDVETGGELVRHQLATVSAGPTGLLTGPADGYVAGFVTLAPFADAGLATVARLCRLAEVIQPAAAGGGFTVDADAHAEADARVLAGDPDGAVAVLSRAGVPPGRARAWVDVVRSRRHAVAVSVTRRLATGADGPVELRELRWLTGGDGAAWQVEPVGAADLDPPVMVAVTPLGGDELARRLARLCGPAASHEERYASGSAQQPDPGDSHDER